MIRVSRVPALLASGARLVWAQHLARTGLVAPLLWAASAGFAGAFATMLFRACISLLVWLETGHVTGLVEAARSLPLTVRMLVPAAGGLVAGFVLWLDAGAADATRAATTWSRS